ncbi:MAG: hypothetical protein ACRDSN_13695 [Pseudonocardiaceae bacterium]
MSAAYLVSSALWSVGGLLVGYGMGRVVRDVEQVHAAVTTEDPPSRHPVRGPRRRPRGQTMIGVLVLVVAVGSTIGYARATADLAAVTECQTRVNEQFRAALTARSDAAGAELAAKLPMLQTMADTGDLAASRAAIRAYLVSVIDLEAARTRSPLPPPASCQRGSP